MGRRPAVDRRDAGSRRRMRPPISGRRQPRRCGAQIAGLHGVTPDQVVLGCGSVELLRMAIDAFAGPQKNDRRRAADLRVDPPVCAARGSRGGRRSAEQRLVPRRERHARAHRRGDGAGLHLQSEQSDRQPHAAAGPRRRFFASCRPTCVVLIDEAYHHYVGESADYASFIDRPVDDPRVIVTRSFSKIHGLAGLRVGYAVAAPRPARMLASRGCPDGVSVVAARAAAAALDDQRIRSAERQPEHRRPAGVSQSGERTHAAVDRFPDQLRACSTPAVPAVEVVEHFRKHRILVSGPVPAFEQYIRVSLGTPAEMREFWRVWDLMPGGHTMVM